MWSALRLQCNRRFIWRMAFYLFAIHPVRNSRRRENLSSKHRHNPDGWRGKQLTKFAPFFGPFQNGPRHGDMLIQWQHTSLRNRAYFWFVQCAYTIFNDGIQDLEQNCKSVCFDWFSESRFLWSGLVIDGHRSSPRIRDTDNHSASVLPALLRIEQTAKPIMGTKIIEFEAGIRRN
jgi:hypothetical protein